MLLGWLMEGGQQRVCAVSVNARTPSIILLTIPFSLYLFNSPRAMALNIKSALPQQTMDGPHFIFKWFNPQAQNPSAYVVRVRPSSR